MTTKLLDHGRQIVVVDPSPDDYLTLAAEADGYALNWQHFTTADRLLRSGQFSDVLCWVIHADLPDTRGVELARLLASRGSNAPVLVVSDEYRAETELEVLASGIAHYACKPLSLAMLFDGSNQVFHLRRTRRQLATSTRSVGR